MSRHQRENIQTGRKYHSGHKVIKHLIVAQKVRFDQRDVIFSTISFGIQHFLSENVFPTDVNAIEEDGRTKINKK